MKSILIVDEDTNRRTAMASNLREQGVDVSEQAALVLESIGNVDAIVAVDGLILDALNTVASLAPTILLSENPSVKASVTALQTGAKDYLALPASPSDLMAAIERATAYSVRKPVVESEPVEMIGSSEIMDTLRQRIAKNRAHGFYRADPWTIWHRQGTCRTRHSRSQQPVPRAAHHTQLRDRSSEPHRIRAIRFSGL